MNKSPQSGYENYFKKKRALAKGDGKKKTSSQPLWLILIATVLAGSSALYLYIGDQGLEKWLDKIEVSMFGEASASEEGKKEEKTAETNGKKEEEKAEVGAGHKALPEAEKKSWTADEISLFSKLEDRKRQLDSRESELNKLEEELQKQKAELEKKLAQLEDVRGKISARLDEKVKVDQQKVEALVSVYASMKPAQAAKVIEGINEDLAVEVLAKMKNKSAAEILNLMDAEKAKKISERYAGYREPASK
jgi:flagellar motility protein MotE (MotC chaperone)